jgi:multiple antibiotic resistance protein
MTNIGLITFATAMFTILNPIGNTAVFAGMVSGRSKADQQAIALRCAFAVAVILVVTVWLGEEILKLFGVEVASLEAAGGLIIGLVAMSMLYIKRDGIHGSGLKDDGDPAGSIAVVPLAMPLVAGPGAIATVIVNTKTNQGFDANLIMSLVCVGMSVVLVGSFLSAGVITRLLGPAGRGSSHQPVASREESQANSERRRVLPTRLPLLATA